jgi:hypothetical protein
VAEALQDSGEIRASDATDGAGNSSGLVTAAGACAEIGETRGATLEIDALAASPAGSTADVPRADGAAPVMASGAAREEPPAA